MVDDFILDVGIVERHPDRIFRAPGYAPPATAARTVVDGLPLYDRYCIEDAILDTGSAAHTFITHFDREALDRSCYLVEILGRKVLVEARHAATMATKTQG